MSDTKNTGEPVPEDHDRGLVYEVDAAIRRCTVIKLAHCRPGEPPVLFNSKITTIQDLKQNGQGLVEAYGLSTYRGWLHLIHPVRTSVARGSQDNEAMALDGWGRAVPPQREDHRTRSIIYKGKIARDKANHFKIWVSLSAADDVNVVNQQVTDFIGARGEELTFETQGSEVDQDDGNTVVEVSQRQWEPRLTGVGSLDGVRVITDGDETLSDVCKHVMGNAATGGQKEEAIILEKTATGFKTLPDDQMIQSLWWEQAHHGLMIATEDIARQAQEAVWYLVDVTVVGRDLLPTHESANYPKHASLTNLYNEYVDRLQADREVGNGGNSDEVVFAYASPNNPPRILIPRLVKWHNLPWRDGENIEAYRLSDVEDWKEAVELDKEGEQEACGRQDRDDGGGNCGHEQATDEPSPDGDKDID